MLAPRLREPIVAGAITLGVASLGGAFTQLDAWYYGLLKPWYQPPDWVFAPAWTILFVMIAWSAVLGWRAGHHALSIGLTRRQKRLLLLLAVNATLNVGWSFLFFASKRPDLAFIEIFLLWASIAALILHLGRYCRPAALMLLPYLAWVTFAGALNLATLRLNPGLLT
ncbi:MAG: tryptophan-rich sensory protein [Betaproteobacteria bacterium]|nr:tryptophan-rich sensory protein [Betaproteobacteria bacterium]NBT75311.1 tryptophan-rich sensory protein [Betaproteobacteria bacterium]NBY13564.1 tryptophan-rich sensory protein [Betaproteobacteria bacterium]NCA16816.1 tryptophan-rich sensory protein [Betaproteobacteria bacterium]NDF04149.1 tryptophan-rich sensory protein [Betaproteobacteria bacterium]